jgi:hypothetical protein
MANSRSRPRNESQEPADCTGNREKLACAETEQAAVEARTNRIRPINRAGLIIVEDNAFIAKPFRMTLERVGGYSCRRCPRNAEGNRSRPGRFGPSRCLSHQRMLGRANRQPRRTLPNLEMEIARRLLVLLAIARTMSGDPSASWKPPTPTAALRSRSTTQPCASKKLANR